MNSLHQDADEITAYVEANRLSVARYDAKGAEPPRPVTRDAIDAMLSASQTLWGTTLPYYLRAANSMPYDPGSLGKAVAEVESRSKQADFLLVGYQDGGLIAVSGVGLPFQRAANDAAWWRPPRD